MTAWDTTVLVGVVVLLLTIVLRVVQPRLPYRPSWSFVRVGLAITVVCLSIGFGGSLTREKVVEAPEQLGVGVLVDGVTASPERDFDVGLFLAMNVSIPQCDEPASVDLTINPTAEFWIDNRDDLRRNPTLRVGVPGVDLADAVVVRGEYPIAQLTSMGESEQRITDGLDVRTEDGLSVISIEIPKWRRTLDAITISFRAPWVVGRSRLGGCYARLPALTGIPTVVTGARIAGLAAEGSDPIPGESTLFVVASRDPAWRAYYDPTYEIARGVTTLQPGRLNVNASLSAPAPTSSIQGVPSWTCTSAGLDAVDFLGSFSEGDEAPNYVLKNDASSGSYSAAQLEEALGRPSCGSFIALDDPSYSSRRDLLLILIGAMFTFGVELFLVGLRRRRAPLPDPGLTPQPPASSTPTASARSRSTPAPARLAATARRRAGLRRRRRR